MYQVNTSSALVHFPQHGTPYSGIRAKGDNKRAYTIAVFARARLIEWDEKTGSVSFPKAPANMALLHTLLGNSAWDHWTKTTGRISKEEKRLTVNGQNEVTNSLIGKGNLNTIAGLITCNLSAMDTGLLYEPGTRNLIERFHADTPNPDHADKAPAKAPSKAAQPAKAATPSKAPAKAAKAPSKARKAPAKARIMIDPKAK